MVSGRAVHSSSFSTAFRGVNAGICGAFWSLWFSLVMPPEASLWDVFPVDGLRLCYRACLHLCMVSWSFVVISGLVAATHESPGGPCQFCSRVAHEFR